MARGFGQVKKIKESYVQRSMKQTDYEHLEKLFQHDNARTLNAKRKFRTPVYHMTEKGRAWQRILK